MHPTLKQRLFAGGRAILVMAWTAAPLSAATVNWGGSLESGIATSTGGTVASSSFTFELGFFANSFIPTMENVDQWAANWKTFDVGGYNESEGWITGTAQLNADGTSSSAAADLGVNFSEMEAYVWVYNVTSTGFQAEWFLARNEAWVFPTASGDECCDEGYVQWSLGDLGTGDKPVIGAHGEVVGGGVASTPGVYTIQTYAVPEPGSLWLMTLSLGACFRRRRVKSHN
ncbi:MAG: PEP-CTERM sorting domain-containing protein [Verrucomicrobiaceae bacterium]|nr:MAG: PEP-CTERM sorting domain-containing protein [Verrucomicrobiaceae bacterium]